MNKLLGFLAALLYMQNAFAGTSQQTWQDETVIISMSEENEQYRYYKFCIENKAENEHECKKFMPQGNGFIPIAKVNSQKEGVILRAEDNPEVYFKITKKGDLEIYGQTGLIKKLKKVK